MEAPTVEGGRHRAQGLQRRRRGAWDEGDPAEHGHTHGEAQSSTSVVWMGGKSGNKAGKRGSRQALGPNQEFPRGLSVN